LKCSPPTVNQKYRKKGGLLDHFSGCWYPRLLAENEKPPDFLVDNYLIKSLNFAKKVL